MTEPISEKFYISSIPRIDPEEKKVWLEALLSGKYPQGRHKLKTESGAFCCLGVYCEVKGVPSQIEQKRILLSDGTETMQPRWYYGDVRVGKETNWSAIPDGFGIPLVDPYDFGIGEVLTHFYGEETVFTLTQTPQNPTYSPYSLQGLNDNGFTFNQIADIINYFL